MGSAAVVGREYILTSGSVQLQFQNGAQVIVQGPAVFEVAQGNRLEVTVGRCSVYCPPGAEGFVVDTPNAHVVDRGTRFFVNVVESSATEVHVVDGIADVYAPTKDQRSISPPPAEQTSPTVIRLAERQARMIESNRTFATEPTEFKSSLYQYGLPDRLLSYQATTENGGAKDLISLEVQRGGKVYRLPVEELVRSKLTWFKIEEKIFDMRHLAGEPQLPADRQELMLDTSLNTGAINPGGSVERFMVTRSFLDSQSLAVTPHRVSLFNFSSR